MMDIAFVLYEDMTALDVVGPADVLARLPGVRPHYVAESTGPVRADNGMTFTASTTFDQLDSPDVIVVPGSSAAAAVLERTALPDWLRAVHPGATWTTSVCTGSTLLAEAGILDGRLATTHWAFRDLLTDRGVRVSTDRVVTDGDVITAAGVSAGLDMALTLAGRLVGDDVARMVQLVIEYDPDPPYDTGSAESAPPELVEAARALLRT